MSILTPFTYDTTNNADISSLELNTRTREIVYCSTVPTGKTDTGIGIACNFDDSVSFEFTKFFDTTEIYVEMTGVINSASSGVVSLGVSIIDGTGDVIGTVFTSVCGMTMNSSVNEQYNIGGVGGVGVANAGVYTVTPQFLRNSGTIAFSSNIGSMVCVRVMEV